MHISRVNHEKKAVLHWIWLGILILAVLPAPATAGLMVSAQGDRILSRTGSSSFTLTITDTDIPEDGKITIDVSNLAYFVANSTFTDANSRDR